MDFQMKICSVLLVVANCGLFTLPAFYIIKDYAKSKRLELPIDQVTVEAQPQTEAEKLSGTEEEQQPKQITNVDVEKDEKVVVKSEDGGLRNEDIEVCNELNQEMKIGKIYHAKKESVDNYSIMQSSGLGLLSPLQTTVMSSSRLLLSPLCTSPALAKQVILSPTPKEDIDGMQKTAKQKKINITRINMKQFVVNELESKNTDTEKTLTETARTEITSVRTQGEAELENLLTALKLNKINTKNNEEGTYMNL